MKRVTGIGGIFFKCEDAKKMKNWYGEHLGIETDQYGGHFKWRDDEDKEKRCVSSWSTFAKDSDHFAPSKKDFMFNYRVADLVRLLEVLREEGVTIVGELKEYEYGKFAWILDPEGNKVELWEPIDQPLLDYHEK